MEMAQTFDRRAGQDRRLRLTRYGTTVSEAVMRVLRWLPGRPRRS